VHAAAAEAVERELEPEEEEEEDDAELGDEVGHLGRLDHAQLARLVRPEEEAGEQVRRDRRETHAAGAEAEDREDGDGDGQLRERHPAILSERARG
jgi:hypothetical protein